MELPLELNLLLTFLLLNFMKFAVGQVLNVGVCADFALNCAPYAALGVCSINRWLDCMMKVFFHLPLQKYTTYRPTFIICNLVIVITD